MPPLPRARHRSARAHARTSRAQPAKLFNKVTLNKTFRKVAKTIIAETSGNYYRGDLQNGAPKPAVGASRRTRGGVAHSQRIAAGPGGRLPALRGSGRGERVGEPSCVPLAGGLGAAFPSALLMRQLSPVRSGARQVEHHRRLAEAFGRVQGASRTDSLAT